MKHVVTLFISIIILFSCTAGPAIISNTETIKKYIDKQTEGPEIPALACLVIKNNDAVFTYVSGVRQLNGRDFVTVNDKFHIGSNTKAMTALLAAISVERDELQWDSTIAGVLSDLYDSIPAGCRDITLAQLLSHTSGITNDINKLPWLVYFTNPRSIRRQRMEMSEEIMQIPLDSKPGSMWAYSNFGYVIAGLMLETVSNSSWEELLINRIFKALGMKNSGFGPPALDDKSGQPWGHNPDPVDPGTVGSDNPPVIGPAGIVHTNLEDLALYLQVFINEGNYPEESPLISRESYDRIIAPLLNDYGLGWFSYYDGSLKSQVLSHDGSNTMFYSTINVYPDIDSAVVVLCNSGTEAAKMAVAEVREYLVDSYIK